MTDTQTALEALMILADGGDILESSGSYGQMTICDTEGKEYVINFTSMDFSALATPKALQIRPVFASPPDQSARIAELEAEKREMLDALEPFALYSKSYDPDEGDSDQMAWDAGNTITIGQLRKAAALHNKLKEK